MKTKIVEHCLENRGHAGPFIPKFHCELNPIEIGVWGQAKVLHTYHYCSPGQMVSPALGRDGVLASPYFEDATECEYTVKMQVSNHKFGSLSPISVCVATLMRQPLQKQAFCLVVCKRLAVETW